jgi:hypothetical protein
MLRRPVRISRPDLSDEVRNLVDLVCAEPDGRHIPLTELLRILGITIAPDFHQRLSTRGDLVLHPDSFENVGPAIRRRVRLVGFEVNLDIAPHLRGRLVRFHDSFQLAFEPDHSVAVSKFLFNVELRHLDLNHERIFVDFAGAQDVFIDLGPPT